MALWRCTVCGYAHHGDAPPDYCPKCGVGPEEFQAEVGTEDEGKESVDYGQLFDEERGP